MVFITTIESNFGANFKHYFQLSMGGANYKPLFWRKLQILFSVTCSGANYMSSFWYKLQTPVSWIHIINTSPVNTTYTGWNLYSITYAIWNLVGLYTTRKPFNPMDSIQYLLSIEVKDVVHIRIEILDVSDNKVLHHCRVCWVYKSTTE